MWFTKRFFALLVLITAATITACKKVSNTINDPAIGLSLADALSSDANLSTFNDLVKKAGLDSILRSSKTYTVWAPTNAALQSLDPAIVADAAKLKSFVLNHISNQSFFTRDVQGYIRVPMLNGKYNNFFGNKLEDANITVADKFVNNGVLHVIDKAILVLPNLWEFINSTTGQYLQNSFVAGLNFPFFDPSLATIDSISSSTGLPIYHPGTGIIIKNSFNEKTFDVRREEKQYTYFIIANPGFTTAADALKPYFKSATTAITDSLDKWNVVKDLVVDTLYPTIASLPAFVVSKFGIRLPVSAALVIDSKKVSNGMVYVLSSSGTSLIAKFPEIRIEGEAPSGFQSAKTGNTMLQRIRRDPATGQNFTDLLITAGHAVTDYYAFYRLNEMPTIKYNVFARAVNDFESRAVYQSINAFSFVAPSTFTQLPATPVFIPTAPRSPAQLWFPVPGTLGLTPLPTFYSFTPPSFAAVSVPSAAGAYNELFLGSFTTTLYGTLDLRLTSGPTLVNLPALPVFGATGQGPMVLDYIRLVPVP